MDVDVIAVDDDMGRRTLANEGDAEANGGEVTHSGTTTSHDEDEIFEPHVGMEFDSEHVAKNFYDVYARRLGFSSKVGLHSSYQLNGTIVQEYVCSRDSVRRSQTCDAMIRVEMKSQHKWVVTKFVKEHNHPLISSASIHHVRPEKHSNGAKKSTVQNYAPAGGVPSGVLFVSVDGNHASTETNRGTRNANVESNRLVNNSGNVNYFVRPSSRKRTLGRDAQNLLDYFKKMQAGNPGFFYAMQLDEDNHMTNVFWADARSRAAYGHFGDVVTLDTASVVYQYRVPFVPFTGVNHHGQTILFGCALLLDDSETSFVWLFKTFLTAMNDRPPMSIVTDQDKAIELAISQVFPKARHCISKWHILRDGPEKLAHVCRAHPSFQVDLYNCINMTETIEEFESSWGAMIDKYELYTNHWLQSLYNSRALWAPVYFRDSFFAAISPNQGYEGSFFNNYVNYNTTLPLFFRQYERALENSFEKEIEADFDTICTTAALKTPSPMEKQAANLYTRKIFAKFQEELVETFVYTANRIEGDESTSTFRVAKFEDDTRAYIVTLNYSSEMKANCSCQMFEYSGILCRHVLTVFTVTNVLTLPSHYILKRWTRNAKSGPGVDDHASELQGQGSLVTRYNSLCEEAMRYAEEGAIAVETYNAAISAIRDGRKKISSVKKNIAKVPPPSSHVSGISHDNSKSSASASDLTPLLWPRQDEVTRRLNLNDNGASLQSVADLNLPRMAPVSLHRDDNPIENTIVLPCLKSMTWVMENKNSMPGNRVAVINLKLQDYSKASAAESEVKFQLSRVTLEPMLRSMAYISEQLSSPANRVAVINLKLQDTETTTGESEVKFQVSKDTLGAMLRSMAYIREQLSNPAETQSEQPAKKQRR